MIKYGIFDEKGNLVRAFETLEEGVKALSLMNDGEVRPYNGNHEGYYTDHYDLERGYYSRVCKGKTEFQFHEGMKVESLPEEFLGSILLNSPDDELETLLETLDLKKAKALFDSFTPPPIKWNEETRTMVIEWYYLETEDALCGDVELFCKCAPFVAENSSKPNDKMDTPIGTVH